MKMIAGAIVIFSGAFAYCAGMAVEAFARSDFAPWAMLGGVLLTLSGLWMTNAGLIEDKK